jgi:hypothetical protein
MNGDNYIENDDEFLEETNVCEDMFFRYKKFKFDDKDE